MCRKKTKPVTCICYGKAQTFPSRRAAQNFYWDCVENSEGSERERYLNILAKLHRGEDNCSDD